MAEKEKLVASMEALRQRSRTNNVDGRDTEVKTTWRDLIAEVQAAGNAHKNTTFAKMCDKANIFEHWLNLLPNGDYTSTISGAFIMSIQVSNVALAAVSQNNRTSGSPKCKWTAQEHIRSAC